MEAEALLRKLGFNDYELKTYLALVKLKTATASQVAKESNVPRNKTYEVLERLSEKGFLMEIPATPKKFKILSLDKLKEVVADKKKELNDLEKDTEQIIEKLNKKTYDDFQDMVWIIKGQKNIVQKIAFETKNLKKEALSVFRSSTSYSTSLRTAKEAIDRGVKIKFIGAVNKNNLHKIKQWIKVGVEVRVYDEKKFGPHGTRFSIFDDRACRLTIGKPEVKSPEDYITIWAESPSLVNMFRRQFYHMWDQCVPVEEVLKKLK
jgi:sugar-specific transcriptional regulator TrmB